MENLILINQSLRRLGRFKSVMHLYSQILIIILVINSEKVLADDTILTINGVLGQSIGLPCNLESHYTSTSAVKLISDNEDGSQLNRPLSIDEVYGNEVSLILWYRHRSSGVPIYAIDSRQQSLNEAQHQSYVDQEKIEFNSYQKLFVNRTVNEIFQNVKGRFVFNLAEQPPKLWIRKLELNDEGEYRCRIDYRGDRTQNFLVHLRVAVPPTVLNILNSVNKELDTGRRIGPYYEEDYVSLTCVSIGGKPLPSLHWYSKDNLTDSSYIVNVLDGKVENELIIGRLERKHFDQKYECRAEINQTILSSTYVVIDLYLKPLTINLTQIDKKLSAGNKAEFECSSSGSKPPAELVFFKDGKPIRNNNGHLAESKGNLSFAKLVTILNNSDDGKKLTCRAFNPKIPKPNEYLEQSLLLDVTYLPQLTVNLGTAIRRENIREDTDVYLDCNVKSNPPVQEIQWTFEKEPIVFDQSKNGGKILSINHTLIMQQVKKERRGNYACIARNALGESTSQQFFLKIKYSPICKNSDPQVLMIDKNELVQLNAEFNADPTELQYSWTLNYNENLLEDFNSLSPMNNQSEIVNKFYTKQISLNDFTSNHTQSTLNYVINERNTYGEIHCYASNSLGSSAQPCRFLLVPRGPPCIPTNCDLKNSINEIILNCEHCDQVAPNAMRKNGRTRNHLDTVHMLIGQNSNDIAYNLKVYMPVNTGDLIRKPSSEWADQNTDSENSIINNARKQEADGLIQVNDDLKTTNPMKYQDGGQSGANNFNPSTALLVKNLTNSHRPQFRIGDLKPATVYLLFLTAFNAKGMSEVRSFSISTLGSPERQLAMDAIEQVSFNPLLLGLIAFVSIVVFFSTLILIIIRMKATNRQDQTNLANSNDPGNNISSNSINCPNQNLNSNKLKITDTSKDKSKKTKNKGKSITLQSVTKLNEFQYKDGLELRETNYGLPGKTNKKNGIYEYNSFNQDVHNNYYTSNNLNHITNIGTPSPSPSSNTTSMLNTQPIYNSSSAGGSSLQLNLNSSYNYPPANSIYHQQHRKFGTLNNSPNNILNQSLNDNLGPLNSLQSNINSIGGTANLNSLQSLGSTTALITNNSSTANLNNHHSKRVMFVGDTPQTIQTNSNLPNTTNLLNTNSDLTTQLLPAHSFNGTAYPIAQPVYNNDLNITDVFYNNGNMINNSTTLQAPIKLPKLNYLTNSRINLNNSLNTLTNQSANQQQSNSMYFPVVSYRLSKEQINHSNSNNGNHATPV